MGAQGKDQNRFLFIRGIIKLLYFFFLFGVSFLYVFHINVPWFVVISVRFSLNYMSSSVLVVSLENPFVKLSHS